MKRWGVDRTAVIGALLRALFLALLILASNKTSWLWWAALVWGLTVPFTWLPYHYTVVAEDDGDGKFGKEVSHLVIVEKISTAAAPFIGGLIIVFWGFAPVYKLAIGLTLISAVPMLIDRFDKKGMRLDFSRILGELLSLKNWPFTISLAGTSLEDKIYGVLRPLLMYLGLISVAELGGIESAAILLSLIVTWWAGRWVDKKGFGIMKMGVIVNALALLLFPFLRQGWEFLLLTSVYVIVAVLIWTPFAAAIYEFASQGRRLEFFIRREMIIHSSSFLFSILLFFGFRQNFPWSISFSLGSLGLIMCLSVIKGVNHVEVEYRPEINKAAFRRI